MTDELLPQPTGTTPLPPPSLSPEQQKLCKRLDEWHELYKLKVRPSKMFEGAIFATAPECQGNPDRISQAAHSLREILYPFWSSRVKKVPDKKEEALKQYGSVHIDKAFIDKVGRVYGQLSDLAHHSGSSTNPDFSSFTISDFELVLADFERVMRDVLKRQTDIQDEIIEIVSVDPTLVILDNPTV